MSSDIYIPLDFVLSRPDLFKLDTVFNVDVESAAQEAAEKEPNWQWVEECLKPTITVKFHLYPHWRYCDIAGSADQKRSLHVPVGGDFRRWLLLWLPDNQVPFEVL